MNCVDLCPQAPVSLHISREPTLPTTASGGWGARLWIRQETSRLDIPFPAARVIQLFIHRCDIPAGLRPTRSELWRARRAFWKERVPRPDTRGGAITPPCRLTQATIAPSDLSSNPGASHCKQSDGPSRG